MTRRTSLGVGKRCKNYSDVGKAGPVDRRKICGVCNVFVGNGDPDSVIIEGQSFHSYCLTKKEDWRDDERICALLRGYFEKTGQKLSARTTKDEQLVLSVLKKVFYHNGVNKR